MSNIFHIFLRSFFFLVVCGFTFFSYAQVFTETTETAGIEDTLADPDTFGLGASISDYDNDGDLDIFVGTEFGFRSLIYENLGNGQFQDVSSSLGITETYRIRASLWFDYDGDQLLDLLLFGDCLGFDTSCNNRLELFLYKQAPTGVFNKVQNSGLDFGDRYSTTNVLEALVGGMASGDINNDGYLDLVITGWGKMNLGVKASVFLNNGNGTFSDITDSSNLGQIPESRYQPIIHDFNQDGFQDVFISVDFAENELWINNQNNTFNDIAASVGANSVFNEMGAALGDYDNDGDFDIYATNISRIESGELRHNIFLQNNWSGSNVLSFNEISNSIGVGASGWDWGTTFLDANNNGWLDLATTNGYNLEGWGSDPSKLWLNVDGQSYTDISLISGFNDTKSATTLLAFDMDRDGDLDLLQSIKEQGDKFPIILYENDVRSTQNPPNYLTVKPRMNGNNHFAIGAVVKVTYNNGQTGMRLITAGTSFYGQEPAEAFFGLADNTSVDEVRIEWPDGTVTLVENVPANQVITITNDNTLNTDTVNKKTFRLYPNPIKDIINIQSTEVIALVEVFNVLGQKVISKETNDKNVILHSDNLPAGSYFVSLYDSLNNSLKTHHIIKQ